jgi:hypothetical protein
MLKVDNRWRFDSIGYFSDFKLLADRCELPARLFSSVFIFRAPGGVRTRRIMTGAAPIPLTGIAQNCFHSQRPFKINLKFMPFRFRTHYFYHTHFLASDATSMVK